MNTLAEVGEQLDRFKKMVNSVSLIDFPFSITWQVRLDSNYRIVLEFNISNHHQEEFVFEPSYIQVITDEGLENHIFECFHGFLLIILIKSFHRDGRRIYAQYGRKIDYKSQNQAGVPNDSAPQQVEKP